MDSIRGEGAGKPLNVWQAILFLTPAAISIIVNISYGSFLIDDAYITFRYAENLAAGQGLVYNAGERVLGTSTPLYAILLGICKIAGIGIPEAARGLGLLSCAGLLVIAQLLAWRFLNIYTSLALAVCIALYPAMPFIANSGMETCLSMVAVYGAFLTVYQRRYFLSGLIAGSAFLIRPDGALMIALVIIFVSVREPRRAWRAVLGSAMAALPWAIYAVSMYGRVLPHSVLAKQLIHTGSALSVLFINLVSLALFGNPARILLVFGLAGMFIALKHRSELLLIAVWIVLYLGGLSYTKIEPFFAWYTPPLVPGIMLLAAYFFEVSIKLISERLNKRRNGQRFQGMMGPIFFLVLAVLFLFKILPNRIILGSAGYGRVNTYLEIGKKLNARVRPGEAVLVGEVGALGYLFPNQIIIDSDGITSPELLRLRRMDKENLIKKGISNPSPGGSAAWVLDAIKQFNPDYIITYKDFIHIFEVMKVPWIQEKYARSYLEGINPEEYIILERRIR